MYANKASVFSVEEYLELDSGAHEKREYFDGQIISMAGASYVHNDIVANVITLLRTRLRKTTCKAMGSDLRVKASETTYFYPDVSIHCGEPQFGRAPNEQNTLINPIVIIEVLSDSTEAFDRGDKANAYRQIASLKEYILVSHTEKKIEKFSRHGEASWLFNETDEKNDLITINSLEENTALKLDEVYDQVNIAK